VLYAARQPGKSPTLLVLRDLLNDGNSGKMSQQEFFGLVIARLG